jgi:hypothetical protein
MARAAAIFLNRRLQVAAAAVLTLAALNLVVASCTPERDLALQGAMRAPILR